MACVYQSVLALGLCTVLGDKQNLVTLGGQVTDTYCHRLTMWANSNKDDLSEFAELEAKCWGWPQS